LHTLTAIFALCNRCFWYSKKQELAGPILRGVSESFSGVATYVGSWPQHRRRKRLRIETKTDLVSVVSDGGSRPPLGRLGARVGTSFEFNSVPRQRGVVCWFVSRRTDGYRPQSRRSRGRSRMCYRRRSDQHPGSRNDELIDLLFMWRDCAVTTICDSPLALRSERGLQCSCLPPLSPG
jgi:hypothetical protein